MLSALCGLDGTVSSCNLKTQRYILQQFTFYVFQNLKFGCKLAALNLPQFTCFYGLEPTVRLLIFTLFLM